ncbi:MAG TPA: polysaccharide biosynthesis/export family protein [Pyrinomonadaceae bacterium]|nr:polysaccharide biosynthesis/export family protein [Pyrinomonadaceae bacterium]
MASTFLRVGVAAAWVLALGAALLAAPSRGVAQTNGGHAAAPGVGAGDRAGEPYRIGPGDVLEVRVFNRPQLSREAVRVEGDGTIRLPLVEGGVRAACLTEGELAREIARRYLKYLKNPQVDIFLKEFNSTPVAVLGAVASPGRFQLQRRVRLLELLSFAGGPTERAGRNVQVVHSAPPLACEGTSEGEAAAAEEASAFNSFRLGEILRGDSAANPYVRPGDIVTVTEAEQAYVVGNVLKPSMIPLKERVTVSQAIAMAGGTLPDTQSERVRVVRQTPDGAKTEIVVDLKAIAKHRAEDVTLQANDIVEVPTASGKRFLRTLLGSAVPSAARLPVQIIR